MRLTLINFFKDTVPGHIFRGKRRLVKQVTKKSMNKLMAEYEMQERNMQLLKNPFITRVSLIQAMSRSGELISSAFRNNPTDTHQVSAKQSRNFNFGYQIPSNLHLSPM